MVWTPSHQNVPLIKYLMDKTFLGQGNMFVKDMVPISDVIRQYPLLYCEDQVFKLLLHFTLILAVFLPVRFQYCFEKSAYSKTSQVLKSVKFLSNIPFNSSPIAFPKDFWKCSKKIYLYFRITCDCT